MPEQFEIEIDKHIAKVERRMDDFVAGLAARVYVGIVMKNPVDTGRSQNNWNVGINNVDSSVTPEGQKNKYAIIRAAQNIIRRIKAGDVLWITNNVDYIEYLEKGHSDQAANGMVSVTLREIPQIVSRSAQEAKRENP